MITAKFCFVRPSAVDGMTHTTNGRQNTKKPVFQDNNHLAISILFLSSNYICPSLAPLPPTLAVAAVLSRRKHPAFCGSSHSHANRMQPPQLSKRQTPFFPFTTTALKRPLPFRRHHPSSRTSFLLLSLSPSLSFIIFFYSPPPQVVVSFAIYYSLLKRYVLGKLLPSPISCAPSKRPDPPGSNQSLHSVI